jgi:hypothetical protein
MLREVRGVRSSTARDKVVTSDIASLPFPFFAATAVDGATAWQSGVAAAWHLVLLLIQGDLIK